MALPDTANLGDSGHVADHNLMLAALTTLQATTDQADLTGADDYTFGATTSSLPASYSWEQQGATTYGEATGRGTLIWDAGAFNYIRGIYRTLPGTFNSVAMKYSHWITGAGGNQGVGLILRNSSSGKLCHFAVRTANTLNLTFFSAASSGTVGLDSTTTIAVSGLLTDMHLRIVRNTATSWDFQVGSGSGTWLTIYAAVDVTAVTQGFTPDQAGFGCLCIPAVPRMSSHDWIKFT